MSDQYPAEIEDLRLRTRDFIRKIVIPAEPRPGDWLPRQERVALQEKAKAAGVFAPLVSRDLGGLGTPLRFWSPILQEAGYSPIGPAALNCMAPDEGNMHMLGLIATEQQKQDFLAPLASGRVRSSFAMTEPHPGAGSDPAALQTLATKVDGGWLINGHKRFISGADGAGVVIILARNAEYADVPAGATMFISEMDRPGLHVGEHIHTIDRSIEGGHPHLSFTDFFVPDDGVLGKPGLGFRYAQERLGPARLTHCMRWLGLARRAFDYALDRANNREVFGALIADLGIAQEMIALSVIDIETSDAIIAKTANLLETDPRKGTALSSVAKVHCSEAIFRVIDRAIQICGGDGVSDGLPLAAYLNEVRPFRIYDGANETHKWAIARRAASTRSRAVLGGAARLDVVTSHGEAG